MSRSDPEGRGLWLRVGDVLARCLLPLCTSSFARDAERKLDIRRDRVFGLLLLRESAWRDDRLNGPEVWHFLRGDMRRRIDYQDGVAHGSLREWHGNGRKAFDGTYERGKLHGKTTAWRRNGTKRYVGEYRAGAKTGEWFYLTRHGKLDRTRTGLYSDGQKLSGIRGFNEWHGSP